MYQMGLSLNYIIVLKRAKTLLKEIAYILKVKTQKYTTLYFMS